MSSAPSQVEQTLHHSEGPSGGQVKRDGDVDILKIKWDFITSNIAKCGESVKLDTFFVHSWTSIFPAVTKQRAFKAFKDKLKESIRSAGDVASRPIAMSHLNAYAMDSKIYTKIYQPKGALPKYQYIVSDALVALRIFNVEQQTPYVLALLRVFEEKKISYKSLRKAMLSVEHFHFQFNAITSQRSSGSIASMYARAARNLTEATDRNAAGAIINQVTEELRTRAPKLEEFALNFRNLSYSPHGRSNALVKYVLTKFSSHEGLQFDVDLDRLTIEHLQPQSQTDASWSEDVVNSVGNLILLSEAKNKLLDNKTYKEKYPILSGWGEGVPNFVRNRPEWNPDAVKSRTDEISRIAHTKIWKI